MSNRPANTIGNIATQYNLQVMVVVVLLQANKDLWRKIEMYTKHTTRKSSKLLPPKIVTEIFETLGEP